MLPMDDVLSQPVSSGPSVPASAIDYPIRFQYPECPSDLFGYTKRLWRNERRHLYPRGWRVERFQFSNILYKDSYADALLLDFFSESVTRGTKDVWFNKYHYIFAQSYDKGSIPRDKLCLEALELLYRDGLIIARPNPKCGGYDFSPSEEGWKVIDYLVSVQQEIVRTGERGEARYYD